VIAIHFYVSPHLLWTLAQIHQLILREAQMTEINRLTAVDSVSSADQFPVWSSTNGDARKCSASKLAEFFASQTTVSDDKITQYAAPSATGFSVQIDGTGQSIWLVLTPTGTFATGTIVLPAVAGCVEKQELLVNCTQIVTALTITGNGATVTGGPTALAANGFFRLRFEAVTDTWYRIG